MIAQRCHLVYVSEAARRFTLEEVEAIRNRSAELNAMVGITGVLLYGKGHFMQLLEGELHHLNRTYSRILVDPRHTRIQQLMFHPVRVRCFDDWAMRLINLDDPGRFDRSKLLSLLDQHARASLDAISGFHQATYRLLDEFQRQLMPADLEPYRAA